jgi:hypothetical protein
MLHFKGVLTQTVVVCCVADATCQKTGSILFLSLVATKFTARVNRP